MLGTDLLADPDLSREAGFGFCSVRSHAHSFGKIRDWFVLNMMERDSSSNFCLPLRLRFLSRQVRTLCHKKYYRLSMSHSYKMPPGKLKPVRWKLLAKSQEKCRHHHQRPRRGSSPSCAEAENQVRQAGPSEAQEWNKFFTNSVAPSELQEQLQQTVNRRIFCLSL